MITQKGCAKILISSSADADLPHGGVVPCDKPSISYDSNDIHNPSNILGFDSTPPSSTSTLNVPIIPQSIESLVISTSMMFDLDKVLELEESEFKGVNFVNASPSKLNYVVFGDFDQNHLRKPPKLFPSDSRTCHSPLAEEIVQKTKSLQVAVSKALVQTNVCESEHSTSSTTKKKKKQSIARRKRDKNVNAFSLVTNPTTSRLIALYIAQTTSDDVKFDKISVTGSNQKMVLLSSKALTKRAFEWSLEILRCDVDLQEIGVIGTNDIDRIPVSDSGAMRTSGFESRACYGCDMSSNHLFYGSRSANGQIRCHRDLTQFFSKGWTVGDVITVKLDLKKSRIRFILNGKSVRHTMSLEPRKRYYPMICFSGNCKYKLKE